MYALLTDRIIQYDLQAEDLDLSAIEVARLSTPDSLQLTTRFYHGTLGPDGKIYVGGNFAFNYLHIIHNPNCPGQFCNVEQYAMELSGNGGFSENGMPNLAYFDIPNNELQCDVLDTTTESIYDDNDMYLFPNPAQNIVNIKSEFPIENARIEFYDLSGKAIYSNSIDGPTSSINTSTFPTGIFIYKIFMDNDILRLGKFIKIE